MWLELSKELTEFEEGVYRFIEEHGEILISNMPPRMMGAIPYLKNIGLVEVYKKLANPWATKKRKFVRVIKHIETRSNNNR
jgi:peptidoglycan/xylan/chitin deacetylase (PgdA/CDA1 family)